MLTTEEKREIDAECAGYAQRRAAGPEALRIVQRGRGWVSDEVLREVADYLEMTPDELDSVATFYNLIFRRPVGKHVILICNSVTCWALGYENLRDHLMRRLGIANLGETSADGRFTLIPMVCLGACDRGPAMMIDDDLHGNLTAEKIDEILEQYQ
jgi:NADH-quinone oxidoreductase subunit E